MASPRVDKGGASANNNSGYQSQEIYSLLWLWKKSEVRGDKYLSQSELFLTPSASWKNLGHQEVTRKSYLCFFLPSLQNKQLPDCFTVFIVVENRACSTVQIYVMGEDNYCFYCKQITGNLILSYFFFFYIHRSILLLRRFKEHP